MYPIESIISRARVWCFIKTSSAQWYMGERVRWRPGDLRENAAVLPVPQDKLNMIQARKWELQKNWCVRPDNKLISYFTCLKQAIRSGKVWNVSFVGMKVLLGSSYNNCFAFDPNTSFLSDFLHYNDKENKGRKKNQCLYHQCILALFWEVLKGLDCTIVSWIKCWISGSCEQACHYC